MTHCSLPLAAALAFILGVAGSRVHADQRLEHLVRAAAHLRLAGQTELAKRVVAEAQSGGDDSLAELLEIRLGERRQLETEIALLQSALDFGPSVRLRMEVIALDWKKLEEIGVPLFSIRQMFGPQAPGCLVLDDNTLPQLLEILKERGAVRQVARPVLQVPAGRTATFRTGSADGKNLSDDTEARATRNAVSMQCRPHVKGQDIRLEFSIRWSANSGSEAACRELDTEISLTEGALGLIAARDASRRGGSIAPS
jgi:hypothetical protein